VLDIVLFVFRKICNVRRPHEYTYNCIIDHVIHARFEGVCWTKKYEFN